MDCLGKKLDVVRPVLIKKREIDASSDEALHEVESEASESRDAQQMDYSDGIMTVIAFSTLGLSDVLLKVSGNDESLDRHLIVDAA